MKLACLMKNSKHNIVICCTQKIRCRYGSAFPPYLARQSYCESNKSNKRHRDRLLIDCNYASHLFCEWVHEQGRWCKGVKIMCCHSCHRKSPGRTDERFVNTAQGGLDREYQQEKNSVEIRESLFRSFIDRCFRYY